MRSFDIKSLAILATSLLVKEAFAAPIYETEIHVITEEITVTKQPDGTFETGAPHTVGTFTRHGHGHGSASSSSAVFVPSTASAVSSVVVVPTTSSTSQVIPSTSAVEVPTTSQTLASSIEVPTTSKIVAASSAKASSSSTSIIKVSTEAAAAVLVQNTPKAASTTAKPTTLATSAVVKASSAAVASSSSSSSGGKRGVAYNTADYVKQFTGSSKVAWAYNWGSTSDGLSTSGIEYVPLLWGMKSTFTSAWSAAASSAIASGSKHLMSFNEPDLSTQANLGYADAAAGYKTYMQPFAGKAKLGAPAVTNGASPMGLTWLKSFLSACTDCTIDFVCIHWYDSASNIEYFKSYVQDAYTAGGNRPLWITEFQASGSTDQQNAFMEEVLPWLDASHMVDRYAWFMADTAAGGLMSSGSSLSLLGNTFKTS
ncbi:8252d72c-cf3e-4bb8-9fff-2a99a2913438-CDS [Sclerotinia trifoliorum]|uniref:8252d72c-cf3e-4bb8-9fff-2a99a2913438-CDS n=1 Tax=Sclerotinia trifoliorum TaxID=28548 RepID=A0A8H2VYH0_9HELO|nr:8252d72c-cf3e-4bb8-9fff-2a99a2913438-CDS [Sclerotinia trifoliorum]